MAVLGEKLADRDIALPGRHALGRGAALGNVAVAAALRLSVALGALVAGAAVVFRSGFLIELQCQLARSRFALGSCQNIDSIVIADPNRRACRPGACRGRIPLMSIITTL